VPPEATADGPAWWFDGVGGGGPGSALPPEAVLDMAVAVAAAAVEEEAAMETAGAAPGISETERVPLVGIGKRVCWLLGAVFFFYSK